MTRDRILDTAEALFAEHGFAATSIRDIASHAELTPASLYNHFPGKEALYQAVLARGRGRSSGVQRLSQREPTPDAGRVIAAVMEHLAQRPHLPRLIHQEVVRGGEHLGTLARDWIAPLLRRPPSSSRAIRACRGSPTNSRSPSRRGCSSCSDISRSRPCCALPCPTIRSRPKASRGRFVSCRSSHAPPAASRSPQTQ
jgi:AcrR family transcriptional regulator